MKFKELINYAKTKFNKQVVASILSLAVVLSSLTATYILAKRDTIVASAESSDEVEESSIEELEDALSINSSNDSGDIDKEENVYIITDSEGNVKETIVSDHIYNRNGDAVLEDKSDLTDIENVDGDEKFTQNGENIKWEANGKDIYYRGKTDKKAPVDMKITYYLNDKEISAEDIAGKSGKVKIKYEFTNTTIGTDSENPFIAMVAATLDDDFKSVSIDNGTVQENGTKKIVIGYALPGFKDIIGDAASDVLDDISISDGFEITAEVKEFELDSTMALVMSPSSLMDSDSDEDFSTEELDDAISELTDASAQLVDGTSQLNDGIVQYTDGTSQLAEGIGTLNDSMPELVTGVGQLYGGLAEIDGYFGSSQTDGTILGGSSQLASGSAQISAGIESLDQNLAAGASAEEQAYAGSTAKASVTAAFANGQYQYIYNQAYTKAKADLTTALGPIISTLPATDQAAASAQLDLAAQSIATSVADAAQEAAESAAEQAASQTVGATKQQIAQQIENAGLVSGAKDLSNGANTLDNSLNKIYNEGISQVVSGASQLNDASGTLASGVGQLAGGANTLTDLNEQLTSGSRELAEGMATFDSEGISELASRYNGDLKPLMDGISKLTSVSEDYQIFTNKLDSANGSVRFIYRTEAIRAD